MKLIRVALDEFIIACEADHLATSTITWYGAMLKAFRERFGMAWLEIVETNQLRLFVIERSEQAGSQITAIEVSSALFSAADANCVGLATELLDYGASVDARDRLGARPLSHAAKSGNLELVDLLLDVRPVLLGQGVVGRLD